jgi:hypothetical protein
VVRQEKVQLVFDTLHPGTMTVIALAWMCNWLNQPFFSCWRSFAKIIEKIENESILEDF